MLSKGFARLHSSRRDPRFSSAFLPLRAFLRPYVPSTLLLSNICSSRFLFLPRGTKRKWLHLQYRHRPLNNIPFQCTEPFFSGSLRSPISFADKWLHLFIFLLVLSSVIDVNSLSRPHKVFFYPDKGGERCRPSSSLTFPSSPTPPLLYSPVSLLSLFPHYLPFSPSRNLHLPSSPPVSIHVPFPPPFPCAS